MSSTVDLLALGRRILAEQAFSVLLGAELHLLEPGRAELRLPVRDQLTQQHGFVHAGKSQIVCRCDIFAVTGSDEKLCATAQGTIVPLGAPTKSDA